MHKQTDTSLFQRNVIFIFKNLQKDTVSVSGSKFLVKNNNMIIYNIHL